MHLSCNALHLLEHFVILIVWNLCENREQGGGIDAAYWHL